MILISANEYNILKKLQKTQSLPKSINKVDKQTIKVLKKQSLISPTNAITSKGTQALDDFNKYLTNEQKVSHKLANIIIPSYFIVFLLTLSLVFATSSCMRVGLVIADIILITALIFIRPIINKKLSKKYVLNKK